MAYDVLIKGGRAIDPRVPLRYSMRSAAMGRKGVYSFTTSETARS